jgi:hypothetical protein
LLEIVAPVSLVTYSPTTGNNASRLLEMMHMEIDNHYDRDEVAVRAESAKPSGGIHSLLVVGNAAAGARQFYDEMAPKETDSTEVRVAKEVFRWASAVALAATVVMIVL